MALFQKNVKARQMQTQRFKRGRLAGDEIEVSDDWDIRVVGPGQSIYSRRLYQRTLECAASPRTTPLFQRGPTLADPFIDGAHTRSLDQSRLSVVERTTCLAFLRALVPSGARPRCADAPPIPGALGRQWSASDQRPIARAFGRASGRLVPHGGFDRCHRFGGRLRRLQKKESQTYTAHRAAMGQRTFKTGQSRWYVGYKKHTLRLWWRQQEESVLLVPLVSWVTPANVFEGALLVPSLHYCQQRWQWWPKMIVADMSFMAAELKKLCRTRWQVAVVTRLRSDMRLLPPYVAWNRTQCHQGQPLRWLEYVPEDQQHWFGAAEHEDYCSHCWEASTCPRQFAFAADQHETLFGLLPLASLPAQRLIQQVRPWIEPAQSYEKNQLGLNAVFLNSLRLAWYLSLLADAAVLLRIQAALQAPSQRPLLHDLMAHQRQFDWGPIDPTPYGTR
jgi:hypothetical protein